jgi:arsenate reductase (thioredoxin)
MQKIPKVLFLSRGTSTRSQMAEGLLRALAGSQFQVSSAAIDAGELHPLAIEVMREVGVDISGQKPKTVAESLRDHFRYVIILYDSAKERSPIFPFAPHLLRWTVADPAAAQVSPAEQKDMFRHVRDELRKKVEVFFSETSPRHKKEFPVAA